MRQLAHIAWLLLALTAITGCSPKADEPTASDLLYNRYAQREDLTVAQVKGFHVNDSVKVDVVILVADDSAAWAGLMTEYGVSTSEGITSWLGSMEQPAHHVKRSATPLWRAMAVHEERTLAFYLVDCATLFDALREYQMRRIED